MAICWNPQPESVLHRFEYSIYDRNSNVKTYAEWFENNRYVGQSAGKIPSFIREYGKSSETTRQTPFLKKG